MSLILCIISITGLYMYAILILDSKIWTLSFVLTVCTVFFVLYSVLEGMKYIYIYILFILLFCS